MAEEDVLDEKELDEDSDDETVVVPPMPPVDGDQATAGDAIAADSLDDEEEEGEVAA